MGKMESRRILYSDKHGHRLTLSEQDLGLLQHGMYVLGAAFSLEPEYLELIGKLRNKLEGSFKTKVIEK